MRCGVDGDPKGKVPRGMTRVWTPAKAGPFSSLDTSSSMAFNDDWLIDPRGDPAGGERSACPPQCSSGPGATPGSTSRAGTVNRPHCATAAQRGRVTCPSGTDGKYQSLRDHRAGTQSVPELFLGSSGFRTGVC